MYTRIMLTLLVVATAALVVVMARPAGPAVMQPYPTDAMINTVVDHLELNWATFDETVAALSRKSGVRIIIDRPSLDAIAFPADERHAIVFDRVRLTDALEDIRRLYGDKDGSIEFETTADGALRLFARSGIANRVRVYDVSDLLSDEYWGSKSDPAQRHAVEQGRLDSLVSYISSRLDGTGGIGAAAGAGSSPAISSVEGLAGKLIVSDTPVNQREVEILLGWLRRMR